jgi:hypothetical protein
MVSRKGVGITRHGNGPRHVAVSRRLTRLVLIVLAVAASWAAATDAVAFEQDQRVNALTLQFGTDTFATANAFGGAFVGGAVRSQMQDGIDSSVADGSTSWLLEMPGLTDLSGTSSSPFNVGVVNGVPRVPNGNPSTYDGTADLDWWYDPAASSLIHQLPASFAAATFNAGPGTIDLSMILGGAPSSLSMSSTRIRAVSGPSSAPLKSTNGFPPGHLPDENLPDSLTSFESMSNGQLAGDISARSLAETPIPLSLVGAGMFNCTRAYTVTNSMLDVLVGGCTINIIGTQISPTQPDRAAVAGDVYAFATDATTKQVTGCTRNGAPASLGDCLDAAAYSSYFRFTTDRVIVLPVTPMPPPTPTDTTPGGSVPPPSNPAEFARNLSIAYSGKRAKFTGRLASESPTCTADQKVSVFEKKNGTDPKLGSSKTNDAGKYSLKETNAEGKFYAAVKQASTSAETCLDARSKTIKVG